MMEWAERGRGWDEVQHDVNAHDMIWCLAALHHAAGRSLSTLIFLHALTPSKLYRAARTPQSRCRPPQIAYADKEVQFHLGHDDTALENLMRRIRSARRSSASDPQHRGGSGKRPEDEHKQEQGPGITSTAERVHRTDLDTLSSSTTFKDVYRSPDPPRSKGRGRPPPPPPLRLGKFLRQACLVMETLCEENILSARVAIQRQDGCASRTARMLLLADPTEDDGKDGRYTLFPSKEGRAAGPHHDGGECGWEELAVLSVIAGAEVVGVAFSKAKRSMLVTAHSKLIKVACASGGDATGGGHSHGNRSNSDGCGLVCVWNVESATVRLVTPVIDMEGYRMSLQCTLTFAWR